MSKRHNLREFQQRVLDRLQDQGATATRASMLGVQIAGRRWLVSMIDISEVLPLPPLTQVPLTKPWFTGVMNVRGNLYGVIDIAAYRHGSGISADAKNRALLVAERYAFNAALLVDRVLGLRDVRNWQHVDRDGQIEYQDGQGESWRKLDVPGLLEQAEFLQIGI